MTESGQVPFFVDETAGCPSHILVSLLLLDSYSPSQKDLYKSHTRKKSIVSRWPGSG